MNHRPRRLWHGLLVSAAGLLLAAPTAPPPLNAVPFDEGFEGSVTARWSPEVDPGNSFAQVPTPWNGRRAFEAQAGATAGPSARLWTGFWAMGQLSVRLYLYVPGGTAQTMPAGSQVTLVQFDSGATPRIRLQLRKDQEGSGQVFLLASWQLSGGGTDSIGTPQGAPNTVLVPDQWHFVELSYAGGVTGGPGVELFIDDPVLRRAFSPVGAEVRDQQVDAMAVGIGESTVTSGGVKILLDDVRLDVGRAGYAGTFGQIHANDYETPGIGALQDPPGKDGDVLAVGQSSSAVQLVDGEGLGGGLALVCTDSSGSSIASQAAGVLGGLLPPNAGVAYQRVWWRQAAPPSAAAAYNLLSLGKAGAIPEVGPLGAPLAALRLLPDGRFEFWGYNALGTADPATRSTFAVSPDTWHLLEIETFGAGTSGGIRKAWVDARPLPQSSANWLLMGADQWARGILTLDPSEVSYQGSDVFDNARVASTLLPSHFVVTPTSGSPLVAGRCNPVMVTALTSANLPHPVPEAVTVSLAGSLGSFHDGPCTGNPLPSPIDAVTFAGGQVDAGVYFVPYATSGVAADTSAFDYVPWTSSFLVQMGPDGGTDAGPPAGDGGWPGDGGWAGDGGVPDRNPPSPPGNVTASTLLTSSSSRISWTPSADDVRVAGYRLDGYSTASGSYTRMLPEDVFVYPAQPGPGRWTFTVTAFDSSNNTSSPGGPTPEVVFDWVPPSQPPKPSVTLVSGAFMVSWPPSNDQYNGVELSGVASYDVAMVLPDGSTVVSSSDGTSQIIPTQGPGQYRFQVRAVDALGNQSAYGPAETFRLPGPAAKLELHGLPGLTVPGAHHLVSVRARDDQGRVDTGYQGTVQFSSSPPGPQLPPPYQFTAQDQGTHSFGTPISFSTPGTYTVSVSDVADPGVAEGRVVEVLGAGELRIVADYSSRAIVDTPYVYNGTGSVTVVSTTGQLVTFSACGALPSGFTVNGQSGAVRWTPTALGTFPVCLKADSGSATYSLSYLVTVEPQPPSGEVVADFQLVPDEAGPGTPVLHDPAGTSVSTGRRFLRWRFGDGSLPSAADFPVRRFLLPGGYRPHLTVWDELGRSDQTDRPMKVMHGTAVPPTVKLTSKDGHRGKAPFSTELEAIITPGSSEVALVRWNLGDGRVAFGTKVSVTYGAGRFWPSVAVVDRNGLAGTDKAELVVLDDVREPPECMAAAEPPVVFLDASGQAFTRYVSLVVDGSSPVATVDWELDAASVPRTRQISRTYGAPGWHHGVVTVKDGNGLQCIDDVWVAVVQPPQNGQVGVPPVIVDPAARSGECGKSLDVEPLVAVGTGPVQWTAEQGPDGLFVDAAGQIAWTPPAGLKGDIAFDAVATTPWGSDRRKVTLSISCVNQLDFRTTACGCGAGGGAFPGLLLLAAGALRRIRRRPAGAAPPAR
jgi:hypothetical protein